MKTEAMHTMELNDAELVAQSLAGNRDAFRQIVERYQTLISSLTYCATGNVGRSEDLAQEIFLTAWKQLGELREPAKLRPWLCSIARFRISKDIRHQEHEPVHEAESLEAMDGWASPEPLPLDHVISEEEKAILWRTLERIPKIYREPLVLFYREQQSIEAVARDLELSEDAVKQRLSRGRKLVQQQLLAFVGGVLKQTSPGKTFTLGVVATLPLLATSAKAATVTAATSKGGPAAKGVFGVILMNGLILLFSLFGLFGFTGRWLGGKMQRTSQCSVRGRRRLIQFWRTLTFGFMLLVLPAIFVPSMKLHHTRLFHAGSWLIALFYALVVTALVIWIWQWQRDARQPDTEALETAQTSSQSYRKWVMVGMLGPAWVVVKFVFSILGPHGTWTMHYQPIPEAEAQKIISEHKGGSDANYFWSPYADARKIPSERNNARFIVYQFQDGSKALLIRQPPNGTILYTPWDDSLMAALAEKSIGYMTAQIKREPFNGDVVMQGGGMWRGMWNTLNSRAEGYKRIPEEWQSFHVDVRQWLVMPSTFLVVAGCCLLLRRTEAHC